MIVDGETLGGGIALRADVAVVGADPAGIVIALELARRGHDVVIVESGDVRPQPEIQALAEAADWDERLHAPMAIATRRQIGGTSVIWGGRCVPFDPIDFQPRENVPDALW